MLTKDNRISQRPVSSSVDMRDMVREHLIARSLGCMENATERRRNALRNNNIEKYCETIRAALHDFYGELPVGKNGVPLKSKTVSTFEKDGYRIENVLFDSFPGWEVNASVYIPLDFAPPFPGVIVPVGHSGKQFDSYQLPCQFFTRSGYLVVVFDPPGQASEKQPGNDHFVDGVRCYLTGETSSQYFIADALRCIDYLETRNDADLSHGVAMTGVSGGGTTTTLANLLDDRISVIGPSCCVTPLADLDITQCYCGCPETHMWNRYAKGIDEVDLLCAATPKPTLLMAGELDEVFQINDTRNMARQVKSFFEKTGNAEHFEFFVDKTGHCYSLTQARKFTRFMNQHLLGKPKRDVCSLPDDAFKSNPYEQLKCHPGTDVNIRSLSLDKAIKLEKIRNQSAESIRQAAVEIAGVNDTITVPKAQAGKLFRVWTHNWQQILLTPEEGIELPGTFLYAENGDPTGTILHFDDRHRNRLLYRHGPMARAINFQNKTEPAHNLLSIDLRGWGDTAVAMYPYEMASWGSIDRYLAYTSAALGDSIMAMRIRDGLAALAYLRSRPEVDSENILITGCGLGGIIALHVAVIDDNAKGILAWDTLYSFKSLLETENYTWPADTFIPNILPEYDLPELSASVSSPVLFLNPLDGSGNSLSAGTKKDFEDKDLKAGYPVFAAVSDTQSIVKAVKLLLSKGR